MRSTLEYQQTGATDSLRGGHRALPLVACWIGLSVLTMGLGWMSCVRYNSIAGTHLTPMEILKTTIWMNTGPFVGPLMNGNMHERFYRQLAAIAAPALIVGWLPVIVLRRRGGLALWLLVCLLNIAAAL